jgi:hypothetical protein
MLTREEIHDIAKLYLDNNNFPIIGPGMVTMPWEDDDPETSEYSLETNLSIVSFSSNFKYNPSDPLQQLVPSTFIVFVNAATGEVRMPRHM